MKKIIVILWLLSLVSCWTSEAPKNTEIKKEIKSFNIDDVKNHNTENDCYTIIDKKVYDITWFLSKHPGWPGIKKACWINATEMFKIQKAHSNANLDKFYIWDIK